MSDKITANDLKDGKSALGGVDNSDIAKRAEEKQKRKDELEKVKAAMEAAAKDA